MALYMPGPNIDAFWAVSASE